VKVAYFTAGTVGVGHLVRGLAIRRALARAGFRGAYRMFGPPLPFAAAARCDYESLEIQAEAALRDPLRAAESALAGRLADFAPDLLLVDLFWAPLRWILPSLACEAWLLIRICPEVWLVGPPSSPFAPAQYRRIVAIEPVPLPEVETVIYPVVIANPDELEPPDGLRRKLGFAAGRELVVVVHAGERGEAQRLRAAAGVENPVVLDLFHGDALFPAAPWLAGADRVVAGAGYNAFWEAHWLGYADRTTFLAFPRSIDDQALRLETLAGAVPKENGADVLARWILAG
jgi:hypothetical protein